MMKLQSPVFGGLLAGALALSPGAAQAASCVLNNLVSFPIQGSDAIPIKQNAAVGALIKSASANGDGRVMATCSGLTVVDSRFIGLVPSELPDIYRTSLPGVGVKFEWEPTGGTRRAFPFVVEVDQPVRYSLSNAGTLHVGFYRIAGDFTGGVLGAGGAVEVAETRIDALRGRRIMFDNIPFRLATCSVTTASLNQTVDLGRITPRDFGGDGGGPWKDFALVSEDCDLTQFSEAYFTFSGDAAAGRPELFAVTGGAGGVAVRLQNAAGSDIPPGGGLAMAAVAAGGEYGFRARFQRIAGDLVSGPARSTVLVNVQYD